MTETDEPLVMHEKCADCAFSSGTTPRRTPLQPEKAQLCVESGTMFFCHSSPDTYGSPDVLCRGFIDAFTVKMKNGDYDALPKWKAQLYVAMLEAIEKKETGETVDLLKMVRELPCDS